MGQEETFHLSNERMINNDKNLKNNNYIEYPTFKKVLRPSKSMFEFLYVVGRGGFGKVWMVKYKKTKFKYALKEMSKVKIIDRKSEKSIKNEREFLSKLNNPFIVNMICSFQDYDNLYLVMDLLTGGDLRYHICHKKQFNEEQSRFFSSCILLGLEYIHINNIIHRDIKPENLVLDEKGYVRITDFGVSKKNLRDNSSETSGTPGYMAPEVLCALNHSFQVDFFALGVIIYEFMNGYRPYLGRNRKEIKEAVLAKQIHVHRKQLFENGWSFESGDLINKLLYRKPYKRLGANGIKEIKEHAWFKNINWEELFNKNLKSPFVPKEGDNFDKRYCEGIEQIDTQTRERYQYYKSRNKFKTLFLNYTFVREEEKQEFINNSNNNNSNNNYNKENNIDKMKRKNTSNPIISTSSTKNVLNNKYNYNILIGNSYKNYANNKKSLIENSENDNNIENNRLIKKQNTNSMTNIHSFSILNDNFNQNKEIRYKNGNRNNKFINRFSQDNNNNEGSEIINDENQKLFYSTFKIPNKSKNKKIFPNNINEIEEEVENNINVGYNNNNKMDELKAYINRNEEDNKKNKDNIHSINNNRSCYFRKRSKESNQFRIASSLNKKQNQNPSGYYSMNNNKKKENTINIDFNNIKIDELKVFISRNEEDNKKNKDNNHSINNNNNSNNNNNNRSCYFRKRSKESNQFRIASSLNKKQNQNQNEYYSINNSKKINQIKNDNKYYNVDENNNKNYTSIKININGPININKYNRSSSQTNIFYDSKGGKSNAGKIIKYFL